MDSSTLGQTAETADSVSLMESSRNEIDLTGDPLISDTFTSFARMSSKTGLEALERGMETRMEAINEHLDAVKILEKEHDAMEKAMKDIKKMERQAAKILQSVGKFTEDSGADESGYNRVIVSFEKET